jgi:hypothetical protein
LRTFCVFIAVHHLGRAHSLPLLGEVEEGEDREGEDDVEFASWTAEKRASDSVLLASEDEEYERYVKLMKLGTFFLYSAKPAVFWFFFCKLWESKTSHMITPAKTIRISLYSSPSRRRLE